MKIFFRSKRKKEHWPRYSKFQNKQSTLLIENFYVYENKNKILKSCQNLCCHKFFRAYLSFILFHIIVKCGNNLDIYV